VERPTEGATLSIDKLELVVAWFPASSIAVIATVCAPSPETVPLHGAATPSSVHAIETTPLVASDAKPVAP
jgi:hypothetical protein